MGIDGIEAEATIYRIIAYILKKAIRVAATLKSHEIDDFELSCFIASYLAHLKTKRPEEYDKLINLVDKISGYIERLEEDEEK